MYKHILLFILVATTTVSHSFCQATAAALPASTIIPHFLVTVNFNTTTVLIFPAAVRPVDRGDQDVLAQKQPGVENVLKLKAARKYFPLTNLHVFTADGRIYAFDIAYTDSLASTHDLSRLIPDNGTSPSMTTILLTHDPFNSQQMRQLVDSLQAMRPSHHGPRDRHDKMTLRLQQLAFAGPLLFFNFQITNESNLDYRFDFLRLYIRDRQRAKRTSVQEQEVIPVYSDTLALIPGKTTCGYVIAITSFTLTDGKQFLVEAYEKNGGRTLKLNIRNKYLFRAAKL